MISLEAYMGTYGAWADSFTAASGDVPWLEGIFQAIKAGKTSEDSNLEAKRKCAEIGLHWHKLGQVVMYQVIPPWVGKARIGVPWISAHEIEGKDQNMGGCIRWTTRIFTESNMHDVPPVFLLDYRYWGQTSMCIRESEAHCRFWKKPDHCSWDCIACTLNVAGMENLPGWPFIRSHTFGSLLWTLQKIRRFVRFILAHLKKSMGFESRQRNI